MNIHEKYINRCISLAKNGLGLTYPNPMVGAVIVYEDTIIGEGWHQYAGGPHAEVNAIEAVKNKEMLKAATLYVNLEPCSHHGKTPPCADLIIEHQIPKVVIGTIDSNSKVSGRGVERLKKAGSDVVLGVLEDECKVLNKRFFTFHKKKRPYIILKWAETADGLIDGERAEKQERGPLWISNRHSRQLAHKLRATEEAILVGTNTALNDRPELDCRAWSGNHPLRILIDRTLKVSLSDPIYDGSKKSLVFTSSSANTTELPNVSYEKIDFNMHVPDQICNSLYKLEIQSFIVEGGPKTITSFIEAGLWDEAHVFIGTGNFNKGIQAPILEATPKESMMLGSDLLKIYLNR